jgi:16S rRNA (cytosine967-C5)-methyltransferase
MTPAARIAAAIVVLGDIFDRRRPAADALRDWGLSHRFAGSGDRAAIGGLIFDALRRKASSAWIMGEETPRAIVLGMLRLERGLDAQKISALADGSRFAAAPLSAHEKTKLAAADLAAAPPHVAGDYPEWLEPHLRQMFADERAEEGAALAARAPLDLRVNTLKADTEKVREALSDFDPQPARWAPHGLRIALHAGAKSPRVNVDPAFMKGWVEVQDEGSQVATLLCGVEPGQQVVDLCAGAGGKTLALAAMMQNDGRIVATDTEARRLAPIHARLERAGVHNVEVRTPRKNADAVADLAGRADLVLVDAPCTGSGAWRRNPDAKWRVRPKALALRTSEQVAALDRAAPLVRVGGRLVYVTCSIIEEENGAQVRAFLERWPHYSITSPQHTTRALGERADAFREAALCTAEGVLMTPRRTGTDGFFVAVMTRQV